MLNPLLRYASVSDREGLATRPVYPLVKGDHGERSRKNDPFDSSSAFRFDTLGGVEH